MDKPSEGSDPPIRSLLERYETALVTYAARMTGDIEQARDVVQDTFLKLIDQGHAVRSQAPEALARWLYTTCRNRALDLPKKERRMKSREEATAAGGTELAPDPPDTVQQHELLGRVARRPAELPPDQTEALRRWFRCRLPHRHRYRNHPAPPQGRRPPQPVRHQPGRQPLLRPSGI